MHENDLQDLIDLSRDWGARPGFALAGGGNTSVKTADRLWVKASGHRLATIDAGGVVELDREKLAAMLDAGDLPEEPAAREALSVERVMTIRVNPAAGWPSVDAVLRVLLVAGRGGLAIHDTARQAATAAEVYADSAEVMLGAHGLGGVRAMSDAHRVFIEQWEVESYRQRVAAGG